MILKDLKFSREKLKDSESQALVPFIEIQSGYPVASRSVQSEVALLAPALRVSTHGPAYPRQTFRLLFDLLIIENMDGRPVLLYGSQFHEVLVISSGVETDGE